jgi:hypothetical protein
MTEITDWECHKVSTYLPNSSLFVTLDPWPSFFASKPSPDMLYSSAVPAQKSKTETTGRTRWPRDARTRLVSTNDATSVSTWTKTVAVLLIVAERKSRTFQGGNMGMCQ